MTHLETLSPELIKESIKKFGVNELIRMGRAVIETEAQAVQGLTVRIDENFAAACQYMLNCTGRIVVLGMGKSGHIGGKIAATLASTGSPAFFVHPGEASHGDLGMITKRDVVLAISNSGETNELLTILPIIKRDHVPLIALTGNPDSTLATKADVHIDISVEREACPLGLAPTASTTATLAMGDALAVAMLEARGFTEEDFARSHPGGTLGRRLLLHIEDIMKSAEDVPHCPRTATVREALMEITKKGLGFTTITDEQNRLIGIFTDGDIRRLLDKGVYNPETPVEKIMSTQCTTIKPKALAVEALQMMEERKINSFPVVDNNNVVIGALNIHDLLRAGVA